MVTPTSRRPDPSAAGYTLLEMLIAMGITVGVLGASGMLAGQMQSGYQLQLDGVQAKQEARYAIDWIGRFLRSAGNNPFSLAVTPCPVPGTPVVAIRLDPDGDGLHDDIRLQSDTAPANGILGGTAGSCTEADEDVTISHDPQQLVVTLQDNNVGGVALPRTDSVVTDLQFVYRDASRNITAAAGSVAFVEIVITVQTRVKNPNTNVPSAFVLRSDTRVRSR